MDSTVIAIVIGLLSAIIALLAYIVSQQSAQTPITVVQEPTPIVYNDSYMLGRPYWPNSYWNWYDPGFGPRSYRGWFNHQQRFDHPHIPHPRPPAPTPPPAPAPAPTPTPTPPTPPAPPAPAP